jgi:hypothetical protein
MAPLLTRPCFTGRRQSGRSSGVEHNLAKVGVEGSNPFARSSSLPRISSANSRNRSEPAGLALARTDDAALPRRDR